MEIKDIIRNRRLELGLTMKELAARVGVSEGTISRWESGGIANMKRDKVALLSQVLGIPIDQLMGWEEDSQDGTPAYYMDPEARELAPIPFRAPGIQSPVRWCPQSQQRRPRSHQGPA